jgi:hypothetical protein
LIVHVFTGLVTICAFIFGCIGKRDRKKMERHNSAKDNHELVTAPIEDAKRSDATRVAEETRYTNLEERGRYE